jgi:hypothetical protein
MAGLPTVQKGAPKRVLRHWFTELRACDEPTANQCGFAATDSSSSWPSSRRSSPCGAARMTSATVIRSNAGSAAGALRALAPLDLSVNVLRGGIPTVSFWCSVRPQSRLLVSGPLEPFLGRRRILLLFLLSSDAERTVTYIYLPLT